MIYLILIFFIQFSIIDREDFIHETMYKHFSGKLIVGLPLNVPGTLTIGGYAAYTIDTDSTTETQNIILRFEQISFIEEIQKQLYHPKQAKLNPLI